MRPLLAITLSLTVLFLSAQDIAFPKSKKMTQQVVAIDELPNILMDVNEVTVGEWIAYMMAMDYGNDDLEVSPIPEPLPAKLQDGFDELVTFNLNDEYSEHPFFTASGSFISLPNKSEAFYNVAASPITGVSMEQVEAYLAWRTTSIEADPKLYKLMTEENLSVRARLITVDEWQILHQVSGAREATNQTVNPDTANTKGCYLMNIKEKEPCDNSVIMIERYGTGVIPVAGFFYDKNGLYDIFGNVAEMTATEGQAIGGSYTHWGSEAMDGKTQTYDGPKEWLGFRVVFEFTRD